MSKRLSIVLHLQGKEDALTNVMEDLYFLCSAEASQSYNNTFKAFANLMIHYGNTNPKRVTNTFVDHKLNMEGGRFCGDCLRATQNGAYTISISPRLLLFYRRNFFMQMMNL